MSAPFSAQLDFFTYKATDAGVSVCLSDMSQGRIRAFQGELRGPHCSKAKTLPASFAIQRCECDEKFSQCTSLLVTDPCYWTPELPMLYELSLELELADGTTTAWRHEVGLRRWAIHGRAFFREGKRVVLRGAVVNNFSPETLVQASEAELTLLVREPSNEISERASELGVSLAVDLRDFDGELTPVLLHHTWHAAVEMVILDENFAAAFYKPHSMRIGCVCGAAKPQAAGVDWADVVVFELDPGERPPLWAATCEKPVIAIRRGGAYAELGQARQSCDRLQAEFAPQFDLAGYIV